MTRVVLVAPRRRDEQEFLAMTRAARALHRPWTHPPLDRGGFADLLARARAVDTELRLVRTREDGALVGVFQISQIVRRGLQSGYLGYYAAAEQAGRGLMAEGLELLLAEAFGPLRLHRLEANIQPGNDASIALVQRAGFRREGFSPRYLKIAGAWRDHERWALLADDWRERRLSGSARPAAAAPSA